VREGDVVNESSLRKASTMLHMSTIDAHGIADPGGKAPLLRIAKSIPMDRLRLLAMVVVALATAVLFLTDTANHNSLLELFLLFSLILLAV
jgi:hypothetical protein